jgi:hypothetical protein
VQSNQPGSSDKSTVNEALVKKAEAELKTASDEVLREISALATAVADQRSSSSAMNAAIAASERIKAQAVKFTKINLDNVDSIRKSRVQYVQTTESGAAAMKAVGGDTFNRLTR